MKTGIELITDERTRQIEIEGWTKEHDAEHGKYDLLAAAICYAHNAGQFKSGCPREWPWGDEWWKPTAGNKIRDLIKAGALIAAQIDKMQQEASL